MHEPEDKGVDSLNQDFVGYEQVRKNQIYRLAEHAEDDLYDESYQMRTCDMRPFFERGEVGRQRFAQELGKALEEIGFAIIVGHGIDGGLYRDALQKVRDLFEKTTPARRLAFRAQRHGSVNQGYFPLAETSDIHPDLVEGWVFCRRAFDMDHGAFDEGAFWPMPGFEPFFRDYVRRHEPLFLPLMQSMLRYLGCDPHVYDNRLSGTNFGLRLNYYPPIGRDADNSGAGRILGHEDVDMFTLLSAPEIEGLQALNRKNGKWVRLNAPAGSIILNTGDYMQRLTNDRFPSTTHRVSKPRDRQLFRLPRVSFPLNLYLWEDELLEVLPGLGEPRYEPVTALQFHTRITRKYYGDDYAVSK